MRLNNVFSGRPAYYDRNATYTTPQFAISGTAPHGTTSRFTYTVPSGRKAFVTSAHSSVERITAAAPVGTQVAYVVCNTAGGPTYLVDAAQTNNVVGAITKGLNSPNTGMPAGMILQGSEGDNSTGGTTTELVDCAIVEFDA